MRERERERERETTFLVSGAFVFALSFLVTVFPSFDFLVFNTLWALVELFLTHSPDEACASAFACKFSDYRPYFALYVVTHHWNGSKISFLHQRIEQRLQSSLNFVLNPDYLLCLSAESGNVCGKKSIIDHWYHPSATHLFCYTQLSTIPHNYRPFQLIALAISSTCNTNLFTIIRAHYYHVPL